MKSDRKQNGEDYQLADSDDSEEAVPMQNKPSAMGYKIQQVKPTKSNDEILRRYEELLGQKPTESKPLEKHDPSPQRIQPKQYMPQMQPATVNTPYSPPKRILEAPLDRIQELPSREGDAPPSRSNRVYSRDVLNEKELPPRNLAKPPTDSSKQQQRKTNYSAEYEEGKPFSNKPPSSKKTIEEVRKEPVLNKQPSRSSENQKKPSTTSTTQNFKRKLEQNMVRDKSQDKPVVTAEKKAARNSSKPVSSGKLNDEKKIREELMELNYEETLLQAQLRKIHMDNKERTAQFYKRHNIRSGFASVKELTGEDLLVLEQPEQKPTPTPKVPLKKMKFLSEYQDHIDDINLELRKVNHLLKTKTSSFNELEQRMQNNLLNTMILESIARESEHNNNSQLVEVDDRPAEELPKGKENEQSRAGDERQEGQFTSYKELMKYRKNKLWQRNQRLNFDSGRTVTQFEQQQPPVEAARPTGPDRIETYEIDGVGKLKVNANLKQLLLN